MRILILGIEGYIGTALGQHLLNAGHNVRGIDIGLRTHNVREIGSESLTDKIPMTNHCVVDLLDVASEYERLVNVFSEFQPEAIVHLAEQPSAPFSMRSPRSAAKTQQNNIIGTLNVLWAMKEACPDTHLIKLGTEGEYPDWLWDSKHIPEGNRMKIFTRTTEEKQIKGRLEVGSEYVYHPWIIPTPRYAGSWYHFSKLHDSMNIDYACKIWGLKATDVNQGIVYGHEYNTRLDYDECFGTVVNRFCVQAVIGEPLTIYGTGGQTRGFIALQNSIEAIQLLAENPPKKGEFRVIHQTTEEKSVKEIADMIHGLTGCTMNHIENPRVEMKQNQFTFDNSTLMNLGLRPIQMEEVLPKLIETVRQNSHKVKKEVIKPHILWR